MAFRDEEAFEEIGQFLAPTSQFRQYKYSSRNGRAVVNPLRLNGRHMIEVFDSPASKAAAKALYDLHRGDFLLFANYLITHLLPELDSHKR